jgi:small redox-active disulfide protein 2
MIELKILGPGCQKCKVMASMVCRAVDELGVKANIVKVEDVNQILAMGVMSTPALLVNNVLKIRGRLATITQIKAWITEANT